MSANTKIEWADHTFNPWIGCTQVSPGCDNCYAKAEWDTRRHRAVWGPGQPRSRTKTWGDPKKWNDQHEAFYAQHGRRQRVFCASLADVFDNEVPAEWRADLFDLIVTTPNLDWLLLTKRIGNVVGMLPPLINPFAKIFPNVWIGATIVNQEEADRDIPKLLAVPAAKRFLSMEPLLGPADLKLMARSYGFPKHITRDGRAVGMPQGLHWVIVGGESGPGARPMHPDWARSLRDQCQAAGVPFFFKQWGEWCPRGPESYGYPSVDSVPRFRMTDAGHNGQNMAAKGGNDVWMNRAGKKAAGRLLHGRTWDEVPI